MKLADFLTWLDSYLNFEKTQTKNIFWLDSMKFLCEKLGNPEKAVPCIHVAGSKGKGSICQMLSCIMEQHGKKCGVYASPHISDFRERIRLSNSFFEDEVYEKSADQIVSLVTSLKDEELPGGRRLTWFELVTVFAFLCYRNAGCDFVVYETGLGGRLDSTNVVSPLLTIITPIELEHTEFLGDTVEKIAAEKAGIIKKNVPCVVSIQNYDEVNKVFEDKCREKNSSLLLLKNTGIGISGLKEDNRMQVFFNYEGSPVTLYLRMPGMQQAQNAFLCYTAVKKFFSDISEEEIKAGLENAVLPGRFEIHDNIILDGAHTVKSVNGTLETLINLFPDSLNKPTLRRLLFACAGDKDVEDIIPLFARYGGIFHQVIFTEPETVRNCNAEKNYLIAQKYGIEAKVIKNLQEAFISIISDAKADDKILVMGSFYLVSEVKQIMKEKGIETL